MTAGGWVGPDPLVLPAVSYRAGRGKRRLGSWRPGGGGAPHPHIDRPAGATNAEYKSTCSSVDRDRLSQLTGDVAAQKSASYRLATDYSAESQSTVDILADQVRSEAGRAPTIRAV